MTRDQLLKHQEQNYIKIERRTGGLLSRPLSLVKIRPMVMVWVMAGVVLFCGCGQTHYEISMKPEGEVMERTLTCWLSGSDAKPVDFPADELERFAKLYAEHEEVPGEKKHRFHGRFTASLPSDLGGMGTLEYWVSSMGSVSRRKRMNYEG